MVRRARCRILRLEDQRRGPFAQQTAAAPSVEGPQSIRTEESKPMIVENHLGLDGGVVPNC